MRGPGRVTLVHWIGKATFPKLWHQIRPSRTHTLFTIFNNARHILPAQISAFDPKHLSFALMQQSIIPSHSFDPAVDYITNLLYCSVSGSSSFISAKHIKASRELTSAISNLFFLAHNCKQSNIIPPNVSWTTHPNPQAVQLDKVFSTINVPIVIMPKD